MGRHTAAYRPRHATGPAPLADGRFPGQTTTGHADALIRALTAAGHTPARVSDGAAVRTRAGFLVHRDQTGETGPEQWWVTSVDARRFGAPTREVDRWAAVARDAGWRVVPIEPDGVTPTGFLAQPPTEGAR